MQRVGDILNFRKLAADVVACPACGETYLPRYARRWGAAHCNACEARRQRSIADKIDARSRCGIPARFRRFQTWEALTGASAYVAAIEKFRRALADCTSVIGLIGPRGTGKTQAGCTAVWQAIEAGRSGRIVKAVDLWHDFRERMEDRHGERDWLREWRAPRLLVIDEISEMRQTAPSRQRFTHLIDNRYASADRATVIVGNLTVDTWSECVGDSIADRANEGGGVIEFKGWESFRGAT